MNFTCSTSHLDGTAIVTPHGDIDMAATAEFRAVLQASARDETARRIVVDLAGVTFIDSTALGVLIAAHTAADRRGATFEAINPGPMVTMVLTMTGLLDVLVAPDPNRSATV